MSCALAELPPSPPALPCGSTQSDARADGGARRVTLFADRVVIDRRREGVAMRLAVPVAAYAGVCVALKPGEAGRAYYELRLEHRDAELAVVLAQGFDERAIWESWRAWAAYFGLPTLIERSHGVEVARTAPPRRSGAGAAAPRRRAKRRRAAFVRRHQMQPAAPAVMHRGAEIIARH